jgi:hypothetical protein
VIDPCLRLRLHLMWNDSLVSVQIPTFRQTPTSHDRHLKVRQLDSGGSHCEGFGPREFPSPRRWYRLSDDYYTSTSFTLPISTQGGAADICLTSGYTGDEDLRLRFRTLLDSSLNLEPRQRRKTSPNKNPSTSPFTHDGRSLYGSLTPDGNTEG